MAFSQEVRFKIGGEVGSSLRASFSQATTMAEKAGKQMEKSFAAIDKITSNKGLMDFRRRVAFEEANTVGKIKITQEKMAALSYRIAQTEAGTTKQKRLQLDFDKERAKLAILRQQQSGANQGGGNGEPPKEEAKGGGGFVASVRNRILHGVAGAFVGVIHAAIDYARSRAQFAEAQAESRGEGLASTRARFAATGGLSAQLRQGRGAESDLENRKKFAQQRVNDLQTPLSIAQMTADRFGPGFGLLDDAKAELEKINAEIQKQHDGNALIEKDLKRQNDLRDTLYGFKGSPGRPGEPISISGKPSGSIPETGEAARGGSLSEIRREQIELKRLRGVHAAEVAFGGTDSEASRDAKVAIEAQKVKLQQAQQTARQHLLDVNQDLTGQAAEGRTFANGRQRPLSETERLARRAQQFRDRARRGILTGAGSEAGRFIDSAISDEATVAGRLSDASSGVRGKDVADATSIKPEIVRSNQLLEAIKNSLAPVDVD